MMSFDSKGASRIIMLVVLNLDSFYTPAKCAARPALPSHGAHPALPSHGARTTACSNAPRTRAVTATAVPRARH